MSATVVPARVLTTAPAPVDGTRPDACVSCGQPASTPFCPHCGERRAADHAYSLRALFADTFDVVSPADGRGLRTLWTLVRRPGALTTAYMRGARQPFLSPLRLFLLVNLAYFAFASVTEQRMFTTPLNVQMKYGLPAALARRMVNTRLAARHVTLGDYARRFDVVTETQAKTLIVAMVPMFAIVVAGVQLRRRRPALHHIAFGFHAIAALLVTVMVGGTVLVLPLEVAVRAGVVRLSTGLTDFLLSTPMMLLLWAWLARGVREAYGDGRWGAALKGFALVMGIFVVLQAYRALLFFTTFWAT